MPRTRSGTPICPGTGSRPPALAGRDPEPETFGSIAEEAKFETAFTVKLPDGPYRPWDIAAELGRLGPQNVAPARSRLPEKGLILSPSHGQNEFTVPQFADFREAVRDYFACGMNR